MATTVRNDGESYPGATPVGKVKYKGSTALYGRSGTGKTTLSATWPKPILFLNILDNGTDSISEYPDEDIEVVHITTSDELKDLILWCHKKADKGKLKYKTIVADTMTQLQQILVNELGEKKGLKKSGKKAGDFGSFTKQDWGTIAGDLKSVIMDIRNLDVESVFICQERIFGLSDEEDDGLEQIDPEVGPKLMPSVKNDLNASVSIIGNTFIRLKVTKTKDDRGRPKKEVEKIYCLRVGPNTVYTTKIRKPKGIEAPDFIEDPTFRKIKKVMKGTE